MIRNPSQDNAVSWSWTPWEQDETWKGRQNGMDTKRSRWHL